MVNVVCLADFIRHPVQASQQIDMIRRLPPQSLIPMFDGLNVVSNCAWTVNKPVSERVSVLTSCSCLLFAKLQVVSANSLLFTAVVTY